MSYETDNMVKLGWFRLTTNRALAQVVVRERFAWNISCWYESHQASLSDYDSMQDNIVANEH